MDHFKIPALLRFDSGSLVLATSKSGGVVVHAVNSWENQVGHVFEEDSLEWHRLKVTPITTPITITFTP